MLQNSFTRVTMVSDSNVNFPYKDQNLQKLAISYMPSFAELCVEDIASFVYVICYRYMEVRVMLDDVTCVYAGLKKIMIFIKKIKKIGFFLFKSDLFILFY